MANERVFFKSLDSLRFFAFLIVFFQHAFKPAFEMISENNTLPDFLDLLCNGFLGVSFFFVLSGFLITYLLLKKRKARVKSMLDIFISGVPYVSGRCIMS